MLRVSTPVLATMPYSKTRADQAPGCSAGREAGLASIPPTSATELQHRVPRKHRDMRHDFSSTPSQDMKQQVTRNASGARARARVAGAPALRSLTAPGIVSNPLWIRGRAERPMREELQKAYAQRAAMHPAARTSPTNLPAPAISSKSGAILRRGGHGRAPRSTSIKECLHPPAEHTLRLARGLRWTVMSTPAMSAMRRQGNSSAPRAASMMLSRPCRALQQKEGRVPILAHKVPWPTAHSRRRGAWPTARRMAGAGRRKYRRPPPPTPTELEDDVPPKGGHAKPIRISNGGPRSAVLPAPARHPLHPTA